MQLHSTGARQKKIYLTLARLGRLLPQRLAEFDGTVTNKALKGRTKPLKASKSRFKFTNTKMAAKHHDCRLPPTAEAFQMKIGSRPMEGGPCR